MRVRVLCVCIIFWSPSLQPNVRWQQIVRSLNRSISFPKKPYKNRTLLPKRRKECTERTSRSHHINAVMSLHFSLFPALMIRFIYVQARVVFVWWCILCEFTHTRTNTNTHTHTRTRKHACTTHKHTHTHTHVQHTHTRSDTHIYMYIFICIYLFLYT